MRDKLLIGIMSHDWYVEGKPEESFRYLRECGFEAVDYSLQRACKLTKQEDGTYTSFFDQSEEELLEYYKPFKAAAQQYQIKVSQAHAQFPTYVDGEDVLNAYHIQLIEKMMFVCKYLECPAIVIHPFNSPDRERATEINLNMCRSMIPAAKKYGVKVCLENSLRRYQEHVIQATWSDADEACWYIDKLNEEAGEKVFGFCLDTGHANLTAADISWFIKKVGKRLTVLHIHDNNGIKDEHIIPYTQKMWPVDWEAFICALKEIGYEGALSFETLVQGFPQEVKPQAMKLISEIGKYFRKRIEEKETTI